MALIDPMVKKSAGAVRNEEESHSETGAAHGGTGHSLRHEAEAQHSQD